MACAIEIDVPGPFTPGSSVCGNLICMFTVPENIEGILCSLTGQEKTRYYLQEDQGNNLYTGNATFLKDKIDILGPCLIQAGTFKYPFSFKLPELGIPSTFTREFGQVSYDIEGSINRGAGRYYSSSQEIHVSVNLNLNDILDELTMIPLVYPSEEIQEGCCCFETASISMQLRLAKDFFLVGENINVKLDVTNHSNFDTGTVQVALESNSYFSADRPRDAKRYLKEKICIFSDVGTQARKERNYNFHLKVLSDINIPCLIKCILIRQCFTITAKVSLGDCYNPVEVSAKIKLGHIAPEGNRVRSIGFSHVPSSTITPPDMYLPKNRPPYPVDDSSFPMPTVTTLPTVHLPLSYSAPPMPLRGTPPGRAPPGRSVPSAPIAEGEDETLIPQNGHDLELPPSYDEAIRNKTTNK